ncbi:hypothetical protein D3C71_2094120 [compost metagenome]
MGFDPVVVLQLVLVFPFLAAPFLQGGCHPVVGMGYGIDFILGFDLNPRQCARVFGVEGVHCSRDPQDAAGHSAQNA